MTDTQKLQRLVKMAWDNGWRLQEIGRFEIGWERFGVLEEYSRRDFVSEAPDEGRAEFVIFDHEFIKALCRGKYSQPDLFIIGQYWRVGKDGSVRFCMSHWWESHLMQLAISTNRIDYLWETFGNDKNLG